MIGIIGKKVGMTQIFSENGDEVPVTVLELGPCPVVQVKTAEKDGYRAAQLAFEPNGKKDKKKTAKPLRGHFEKAKIKPHKHLKEFRLAEDEEVKVGDTIKIDSFENVDFVSVTGVSKGRGFAGVVKRHGFSGAPASRGSHEAFRHPGSIGMCEFPARVLKGTKLPGRHGGSRVKALNLEVVRLFPEKNLMLVRGAAPGPNGGIVVVEQSLRRRRREQVAAEAKFVNPLKASKKKSGK